MPALDAHRFHAPLQLQRQQQLVTASVNYVSQVLAAGNTNYAALSAYASSVSTLVLENVQEAAVAEIDLLVQVMENWRHSILTPDEWEGLRFVVSTSHMAANRNLVSQVCGANA